MSTVNPFQIPTCLQRADLRQRRQERLKRIIIASVVAIAGLLVVLLIQGCMTEHAKVSVAVPATTAEVPAAVADKPVVEQPKPVVVPPLKPLMPAAKPVLVHVVKPGDTLSHIAKLHGTTVKALKTVNGLDGDTIAVGAKLKLPTA